MLKSESREDGLLYYWKRDYGGFVAALEAQDGRP